MSPNSNIETGIALEVYIGQVKNMRRINDVAAKIFGASLINERKFLNTLAGNIWVNTKRMFKGFVSAPKAWNNITYNLHDAYCCFMLVSDENGVIKKDYTNWFWKPSPMANGGNRAMNFTPFEMNNNYFHLTKKKSDSRMTFRNEPYFIHSFPATGDDSWRKKRKVLVNRPFNVIGTKCADMLFKNYMPIHNNGITLVFANAIYYSLFLENAMGTGVQKRISKDVISSFITMASEIVTQYGDQSQSGVQVYFRKQAYHYKGVGKNVSISSRA